MTKLSAKTQSYYLKKANDLTKAQFYEMSVTAYRIILLASTDKILKQITENDGVIRISPLDYHEVFGSSSDTSPSYRVLKEAVDELLEAKLKFRAMKRDGEPGVWRGGVNWVGMAIYNDTLKVLEFKFSEDVLPLVYAVQTKYTYYNLRSLAKVSSMHSIRLYELMMFWRKKERTPELSIAYLRTWLGVEDDKYTELKYFNKDVIKKSVEEITKKTDIEMTFEPVKEGRITKAYTFTYTPKNTQICDGEDESYKQGQETENFPPPNEADDEEDAQLPF